MRKSKQEFNVDFIGGAGPLTKEEEKAISAFLQSRRQKGSVKKRSPHSLCEIQGKRI